jgi:lysophospholipase L1-like esterase
MSEMHAWRRIAAASALATAAATVATGAANAAPEPGIRYVALGDSFAAGSGVFPENDLTTCLQSQVDYPALVAKRLHVDTFHDATCGGATLADLEGGQRSPSGGDSRPPQFDALTPDITLVTMTMGGNDIGLAAQALQCYNVLPQPFAHSCTEGFVSDGHDEFADRITDLAPVYGRTLDEIHSRAPQATVVVVGYPTAARPGGCPEQPALPQDIDYLSTTLYRLNDLLREEAAAHNAIYVDTATPSVGHDMCASPDQQWINGLIPSMSTPSIVPIHPNTWGEQQIAAEVVATLQ